MAAAIGTMPGPGDGYPVQVTFDTNQPINRLWGIPILGYALRWIVLIPSFIVLTIASIGIAFSLLVSWLMILLLGKNPFAGFYLWFMAFAAQVAAYAFFLAAPMAPILGPSPTYPVQVTMPTDASINRLWGIPWLGFLVRGFLIIPHAVLAFLIGIVAYVFAFVLWIPILLNGRAPTLAYTIFGGLIRLQARVYAWYLMCPVPYPPLSI